MTRHADGTFHVEAWDEATCAELDGGGRLTRASVIQRYGGAIEGRGTVEYLKCRAPGGAARFVAPERAQGTLGGREGAFVIQHQGLFGRGTLTAPRGRSAEYAVEYDFA